MKAGKISLIILLLPILMSVSLTAQADELQESVAENSKVPANPTLDSRMPAVVPGEEVVRSGKKIKVWSTGGSPSERVEVPVAPAASDQWKVNNNSAPEDISVIIDGRDLKHPPHRR